MLQACLNGNRDTAFHPAVPRTPDELARDAKAVVAAGADALHVHPRDAAGRESVQPADIAAALAAIRASVPGTPVGVSTGWWIAPGGRTRQVPIAAWQVLPGYVSVNLIEEDAPEVIALALGKGIGVEAGLWSVADAERFVALVDAPRWLRTLLEINEQDVAEAIAATEGIRAVLARAGLGLPSMLHGYEATKWRLYREALRRGLDTRIGLEDGKHLPSGAVAESNEALIRAASDLASLVSK
jgi:uncharacterized protein (DUF849 family)